jgi:hypothetical protein
MLKGNPGKQRLSILRIQPPLTVTTEEVDKLVNGLDEVLAIIAANNEYCLIAHLAGVSVPKEMRESPEQLPVSWPIATAQRHIDARTGFVIHPPTLENLAEYYFPSFQKYPPVGAGLRQWWNAISRFLEPIHVRTSFVSSNDFTIENSMVFVPYLPEYIGNNKAPHLVREMQDKIQDAVTLAK